MTRALSAFGIVVIVLFAVTGFTGTSPAQQPPTAVTEISAEMGSCTVDFRVTNFVGEPIYNAKIATQIRHGFLGKRKLDLEAGTNSEGRARFVKMPERVKHPLQFEARWGGDSTIITWDPGNNCHAEYPVLLGKSNPEKPAQSEQ
ncbi:MAG TPA: hypothetical protein VD837_17955 [Terriglobales bacterium]|nr:hypothetical protein [Terriglobales bacterium]